MASSAVMRFSISANIVCALRMGHFLSLRGFVSFAPGLVFASCSAPAILVSCSLRFYFSCQSECFLGLEACAEFFFKRLEYLIASFYYLGSLAVGLDICAAQL